MVQKQTAMQPESRDKQKNQAKRDDRMNEEQIVRQETKQLCNKILLHDFK